MEGQSSVNKISLLNFASKFKAKHAIEVNVLKNHKTVLKAELVKDLDLLT